MKFTIMLTIILGFLAGNVQNGTMELILSRKVTKNQVYTCACILTLVGMLALVVAMFLGTVVGVSICDFGQEVSLWPFFRAATVGGLLSGSAAGVSLLAAAAFNRRSKAVGLAISFFVVNYFVDLRSDWLPRAKALGPYTIFYYVDPPKILFGDAWPIFDMCVLGTILVVTVLAGRVIWNRRDLLL